MFAGINVDKATMIVSHAQFRIMITAWDNGGKIPAWLKYDGRTLHGLVRRGFMLKGGHLSGVGVSFMKAVGFKS